MEYHEIGFLHDISELRNQYLNQLFEAQDSVRLLKHIQASAFEPAAI